MTMSRLKLTLYENAIGFAVDAISNAVEADANPLRWKYAIISLVQSIELSLKEALRRQHPFLVYSDVDKPNKTVGIRQATSRLQRLTDFHLSKDEQSALETASHIRNLVIHHEVDASVADLKLNFARLLGFLNDFHRKHFDDPLQDSVDGALWKKGVSIRDYGEELYRRAVERMKTDNVDDDESLIPCPKCGWRALSPYGDNQDRCYVCGNIEHLVTCTRCNKIMLFGEYEEYGKKEYCTDCLDYITDDYWHDRGR